MSRGIHACGLLLAVLATTPVNSQEARGAAGPSDARAVWIAFTLVDRVVVPRYAALAKAMDDQHAAWIAACSPKGDGPSSQELFVAHREATQRWAAIEFVRYGPISEDLRHERMAHWPDRRNAVGRALDRLITGSSPPSVESVRSTSVAGQGLSVLERILYDDAGRRRQMSRRASERDRRCAAGTAVTGHLAILSRSTTDAWTGQGGQRAALAYPAEARAALVRLATDLLTMLELIEGRKLALPLGGNGAESARPSAAEAWRSNQSLRIVRMNLEAVVAFTTAAYADIGGPPEALRQMLTDAMTASAAMDGVAVRHAVAGPPLRTQLILLGDLVLSLRQYLQDQLPEHLGVTVGFNSQDGD